MDTPDPFSTEKNQIVHLIICSVLYVNYTSGKSSLSIYTKIQEF